MARHTTRTLKKQQEKPKFKCKDCIHSYDWHDKAHNGQMILCRCPYDAKKQYGKYSKLLSDWECDKFEKRQITE